ncbi:hypothetical protein BC567DRAFT_232787 [Phyllosticta citribraziliensis]
MKLAILFFLFAALATAAAVADTGESDKGGSSKTPSTNGPKGKDGLVFLDGPCTDDSECAGGTAGRCGNKDEYLKVLPDGSRKGDKASFACAYAKVLTGVCGYAGKKQCACFPPNDAACTYINDCFVFKPLPKCGVPNAIVDDEGKALCRCPKKCKEARAGFAKSQPAQDDCSDPYKEPGGLDPP